MSDLRVGIGFDAHALSETVPLVLAGVDFPGEPGLVGHSDGDVISHALIDAILGAAGRGDIGELFPSTDPQWIDVSSIRLLQRAYEVVRGGGFELVNADCILVGELPQIAGLRDAMGARLAGAMGVEFEPAGMPSWTDAGNLMTKHDLSCVVFGAGDLRSAHSDYETVAVADLVRLSEILERLLRSDGTAR